ALSLDQTAVACKRFGHARSYRRRNFTSRMPWIPIRLRSRRCDVFPDLVRLALDLLDPSLHDIADRYQSGQSPLVLDRQMAEAAARHDLHDFINGVAFVAGRYPCGHHALNGKAQCLRSEERRVGKEWVRRVPLEQWTIH